MRILALALTALGLALLATCGGGDGNGTTGTPCERLTTLMCQRSCDCRPMKTDTASCYIQAGTKPSGTRTSGRNPLPCASSLGRDVCGDTTKPPALFDACLAAFDQAMCTMESATRISLKLPAACAGILDCASGPCLQ